MKEINIGLFGFGVVGEGIYTLIQESKQVNATVKRVCIRDSEKERNAPKALFTKDASELLHDDSIDLVVELISEADAAYEIITKSLRSGKSVVSANKKVIAENLSELLQLAQENGVSFLYEASVCASIPILRNLEEYFDNDWITGLEGIVNGSTNFILTQIINQGLNYTQALALASENGFAEEDPSLDVEGYDAAYKLSILIKHAYGINTNPYDILKVGITNISAFDAQYAKEKGFVLKLIASAHSNEKNEVEWLVCPSFIPKSDKVARIDNEYNAVIVHSAFGTEHFFSGKGAGRFPTASAVLSDISAYSYSYKYEYKKSKRVVYSAAQESAKHKWYIRSSENLDLKRFGLSVIESFVTNDNQYGIVEASIKDIRQIQKNNSSISIIKF